jgi:hypothetical protein
MCERGPGATVGVPLVRRVFARIPVRPASPPFWKDSAANVRQAAAPPRGAG